MVRQRAYLGESWDYQLGIAGMADEVRVTARPQDVFEVNDQVFAQIDTSQMTVIDGADT